MNVSWYFESSEVMTDRVDAFNVVYLAQDSTGAIDSMSPDKYVFFAFFSPNDGKDELDYTRTC